MKRLSPTQRTRSRSLRSEPTDAEALLWRHLRNRQLVDAKFRRQLPVGSFVADFCCMEVGLVIEVDGGQHAEREQADALRSERLERDGYRVLRFWNHEVLGNTEAVLEEISRTIEECRAQGQRYGRVVVRKRTRSVESPSP